MTRNNIVRPVIILLLGTAFLTGCANQGHHGSSNGGGHSNSGNRDSSSGGHSSSRRVDAHGNVIEDDDYYRSH